MLAQGRRQQPRKSSSAAESGASVGTPSSTNGSAGGVVIDPDVATRLLHRTSPRLAALTPREFEVLELMARGLSNAAIAEQLHLSAGAVSKHVAGVFAKLQLGPDQDNRRVRAVLEFLSAQN